MNSHDLILSVDGTELLRGASAEVVFFNMNGKNFAGEENRDKSYSQHMLSLDLLLNSGAGRSLSFAPGTQIALATAEGEIVRESVIAHHANLAQMPVELIVPSAAGVPDPGHWALFAGAKPMAGHNTSREATGRYRAGVRWDTRETEDFLLFNAAAGAIALVPCSRREMIDLCLLERADAAKVRALPVDALWAAIAEDRERVAGRRYSEVLNLIAKANVKARAAV